jgi:hypothetical protein
VEALSPTSNARRLLTAINPHPSITATKAFTRLSRVQWVPTIKNFARLRNMRRRCLLNFFVMTISGTGCWGRAQMLMYVCLRCYLTHKATHSHIHTFTHVRAAAFWRGAGKEETEKSFEYIAHDCFLVG